MMENYGFVQGVLLALGYRTIRVVPRMWQSVLGCGTRSKTESRDQWKRKIKGIVEQRHPGLKITLKTSDALGILEYAIKQQA